ncbi:LacI family DNA-binding transcriptional regulator [Bogoriella caseilytica]|uniref:LacI family transcriptional regulator n=1 Tax=Bogoriella caseilytica TaxID=56055 RepID=A0A3N2BDX2_9MICO|nr:LacI family DNA-binding transcriptional regulator [Bogoriella caseilytica]ROR73441.1 LacI family transcriptional regulator [Bogoriella caseilytica]
MNRGPTMVDVAEAASVSLKTVSRYINGATNIDPKLAERIREAVLALGYRRNLAAASIRPGWTSRMLGLIIGDLGNPYYSTLARGVEREVHERGYLLTTASSDENGQRHDELIDRMLEQRVDGLIIVPPYTGGRPWNELRPPLPPRVLVDRPAPEGDGYSVLADNARGAASATEVLLAEGATRIAFVGDSELISTMAERRQGYEEALLAAGLEVDLSLVDHGVHTDEQAAGAVQRLLDDHGADAIFAANNRAAIGALRAFRARGARVPLVGFDDFESAELTSPPTTVVSHDIAHMGAVAAGTLLTLLDGGVPAEQTTVLPVTLQRRGSELRVQ